LQVIEILSCEQALIRSSELRREGIWQKNRDADYYQTPLEKAKINRDKVRLRSLFFLGQSVSSLELAVACCW